MKKFVLIIASLVLLIVAGCKDEIRNPVTVFDDFRVLAKPDITQAVFDSASATVKLKWTVSDTTGIRYYIVASSDSSLFDYGHLKSINCNTDSLVYQINTYHASNIKPLTVYFKVAAVFNTEDFNSFVGPQSQIVNRKVRN